MKLINFLIGTAILAIILATIFGKNTEAKSPDMPKIKITNVGELDRGYVDKFQDGKFTCYIYRESRPVTANGSLSCVLNK